MTRIARIANAACAAMSLAIGMLAVVIGVLVPMASVFAAPGDAPVLSSAASRKVHGAAGTFKLALSLTLSNPTTEPRQGPAHTVVFTFDKPVTSGGAVVIEGTAAMGAITFSGSSMIVPLTGVANLQYVTIAVTNVVAADGGTGGSGAVRIGYLAGDVSQNRVVTLSDLGQVNAQIAQFVTGANFLKDINASGTLSLADKGITNTQVTKALSAVPPPANQLLLAGPPGDPANSHVPDIFIPDVTASEVAQETRPNGTGLLTSRIRILLEFSDASTVGSANALLQSINATIIGTMQDIKLIVVNIPDTGDFSGLDHALAVLQGSSLVYLAVQDVALDLTVAAVPSNFINPVWVWNFPPSVNANKDGNWGMEAIRVPQMWNLNAFARRQDAIRSAPPPRTGVLDTGFNDLAPAGGDGANDHPLVDLPGLQTWVLNTVPAVPVVQPGARASPGARGHGEHVAGIIGATFNNGVGTDGINPFAETHTPADAHFIGWSTTALPAPGGTIVPMMFSIVNRDLRRMLNTWPSMRVVNISLGYNWYSNAICNPVPIDANTNVNAHNTVRQHGILVRQIAATFQSTLLAASAGNDSIQTGTGVPIGDCNNDGMLEAPNPAMQEIAAQWSSPFNWAALNAAVAVPAPSANIVVVESVEGNVAANTLGNPPYTWQYTKSDFSNVGGMVSAPGGLILSTVGTNMPRPNNPGTFFNDYEYKSGTSQAAPHVTGLIGYLLHLDETLTAQEVMGLITGVQFTRTTVVDPTESALPAGVANPAPMVDAFAAMLGIDLLPGHGGKKIQRAIADVDDGTDDGNTRIDPFTRAENATVNHPDLRRGDGMVSMQDFRAWRDAYLQVNATDFAGTGIAVSLDGGQAHFKKDLNFDGCIGGLNVNPPHPVDVPAPPAGCTGSPLETVYPRYDFNGDGRIGRWFETAPFKINPTTADPASPVGQNKSFTVRQPPGFLRDIDVMADFDVWAVTDENVETNPAVEGLPAATGEWNPRRYLLGNRDTGIPVFQDIPDYVHSFDLHIQLDWSRISNDYEAVSIEVSSEMVADYTQTFDRNIVVLYGEQPPVVTLPIWTGKVQITFTGVDNVPPNVALLDPGHLQTTTKELTGLRFGEDRALVHPRFPVVVDDVAPGRSNIAVDEGGIIYVVYERQVSSASDGSEVRDHFFARSLDGGVTWSVTPLATGQRRRDAVAVAGLGNIYVAHVFGNPTEGAPIGNASVQLMRSTDAGQNFSTQVISTTGTTNVDFHTDVATDANGKIYVVWAESGTDAAAPQAKNPYLIRMRTSTNAGQSFSAPTTIHADASPGTQWYPRGAQVAVTPNGQQVHVTWTECIQKDGLGNCLKLSLLYSRSLAGGAFSAPVSIAQAPSLTSFYEMTVDAAGRVSVVYPLQGASSTTVIYVRVENGAVVRTVDASLTPSGFAAFAPRVAIDGAGTAWITWFEGSAAVPSEVFTIRTTDGGQSFTALTNISNSLTSPSGASSIAFDHDVPFVVWGEQGGGNRLLFSPVLTP